MGVPRAMTIEEIDEVVGMFINGAKVAKEAGFAGCQLHAAHGCKSLSCMLKAALD